MNSTANKILLAIVIALGVVIIFGTAIALVTKNGSPGSGLRKDDPTPEQVAGQFQRQQKSAFTEIGQLRSATAPADDDSRAVVIVTPWLAYAADDDALYEELDAKLRSIRAIITGYFMNYTYDQLLSRGEQAVKADLLEQINAELVLGTVNALYFNDYQFLD